MILSDQEQLILQQAEKIFTKMASGDSNTYLTSPEVVAKLFQSRLSGEEREHFEVAFCKQSHELIAVERMFSGTINQSSVYPREIVKRALELNAAAIFISHNHPSGSLTASDSDIDITRRIKDSCSLFEIRIVDHIIVGNLIGYHSMASARQL